jgi:hypothetical protein
MTKVGRDGADDCLVEEMLEPFSHGAGWPLVAARRS